MSYRTTSTLVEAIVDVTEGVDLDPYLLAANELVTEICVPAGYDATRLELIERWLAAHFYCVYDPRAQSESAGVSASYEGSAAMFLERTRYGQMAMILDTAGGLAKLNDETKKGQARTVGVTWLGVQPAVARRIREADEAEE